LCNDDLRGADVRWVGLTPAQWGMVMMFLAGAGMVWYLRKPAATAGDEAPAEDASPDEDATPSEESTPSRESTPSDEEAPSEE
jgi:hypothetical protein